MSKKKSQTLESGWAGDLDKGKRLNPGAYSKRVKKKHLQLSHRDLEKLRNMSNQRELRMGPRV